MKKTIKWQFVKKMAIIAFLVIIGLSMAACEDGGGGSGNPLVGKWYSTQKAADDGDTAPFEFTSDGKLLTAGTDEGITYTVSGNTLTTKVSGQTIGTTTFSISGTVLTLSRACTPLAAMPYYKAFKDYISSTPIVMVQIPGGSFQMGQEGVATPVHNVTLTSGFYMGKYEVTQEQWEAVMGNNPSYFSSNPASGEVQSKRPVEKVSWYDAIVFCNRLSMREGLSPAYRINGSTDPSEWGSVPTSNNSTWDAVQIVSGSTGYRLPTEAQWEYAAKGGNGSPGNYTYSGSNTIDNVAWYPSNSNNKTHEVGKKAPNGLGLYDMSGNVYEWCWDWYESYSSNAPQTDPQGASSGSYRVTRGGSWYYSAEYARSTYRNLVNYPYSRGNVIGFRVVCP